MHNIIINADDLGISPGTNEAIFQGYDKGIITHTSIMANGDFFEEAVESLQSRRGLHVGIHLNLTYGKALTQNPLISDRESILNLGYLEILLKSMRNCAFVDAVKKEFESQIVYALDAGLVLSHIDSHRHVHLIPRLYEIVIELAKKYNIHRVRLINENLRTSVNLTGKYNFIGNGGFIKFLILKVFTRINERKENLCRNRYFYSILYTGVIEKDVLKKLYESNTAVEVMVHPSLSVLDKGIIFYCQNEKKYRFSPERKKELEAVLQYPIPDSV